jgi:hypothetical protein
MHRRLKRLGFALGVLCLVTAASAQTFSGRLDDPTNTALHSSGGGAPGFGDDYAIANNVALYSFHLTADGTISIASTGFAAGGVDPYFTVFQGSTSVATFLGSNYDRAFSTGGDFSLAAKLSAGDYQFALGTFANMSFAENAGSGTLADGFVGLGQPSSLGNTYYSFTVSTGAVTSPVPESPTTVVLALGLAMTWFTRRPPARSVA